MTMTWYWRRLNFRTTCGLFLGVTFGMMWMNSVDYSHLPEVEGIYLDRQSLTNEQSEESEQGQGQIGIPGSNASQWDTGPTQCREQTNFVYIKEIKCASSTLVNIFRRFGYQRNLSFALPLPKKIYLGWPYLIKDNYYRPSTTGIHNILCEHSVYDKEQMTSIMSPGSVYISSLREPFAQFKSMFHYYNLKKILNITSDNPVSEYLNNIQQYETLYKSHKSAKPRYCIPDGFSMSRNLMSYILGFPTGFLHNKPDMSNNDSFINDWIQDLDQQFSLVLITEYIEESLVMLRRLMCWQIRDIIHISRNIGKYSYKESHDTNLVDIYKTHSNVDYELYNHFNRTFWHRVSSMGLDFREEVSYFSEVLKQVSDFCKSLYIGEYKIESSRWNKPFSIDSSLCTAMKDDSLKLLDEQYKEKYPDMRQPKPGVKFC